MTKDRIYESFLAHQLREGLALSRASDLVELVPADDELPVRYLARFHCSSCLVCRVVRRRGTRLTGGFV